MVGGRLPIHRHRGDCRLLAGSQLSRRESWWRYVGEAVNEEMTKTRAGSLRKLKKMGTQTTWFVTQVLPLSISTTVIPPRNRVLEMSPALSERVETPLAPKRLLAGFASDE
jgi:hypothetical protein